MPDFLHINFFYEHWLITSIVVFLIVVALYDILQNKHTIKHNFPLVGHIRYWLEMAGPELRQYWVAHDREERPFNRSERNWIYTSAKGIDNTIGYGSKELMYEVGYPIVKHSPFPIAEDKSFHLPGDRSAIPCIKVMGSAHGREKPYRPPSVINISGMSFGSLGKKAIAALNKGALKAGCYHNTGEGGISPYHTHGADLMWQLGTGYFGTRDSNGEFSLDVFIERLREHKSVKCIEIKLSQGAKPGKGGILPAKKCTREIAAIRGVPQGVECISPNGHSQFRTVDEMIDFIEKLADVSGLPVGIKSAVGEIEFWDELARRMKERGEGPDFISIDGSEGGTGAAPLTFADHVAIPFMIGFARVYKLFQSWGLSRDIVWIGSGKLGFPDRAIVAFAMGCDIIHIAREAMISIGCIQATRCHTDWCPSGVATQKWWLQAGLDVEDKAERFTRFMKSFRAELLALSHATGYHHPCQFTGRDVEISTGANQFATLEEIIGYERDTVELTSMKDYGPVS